MKKKLNSHKTIPSRIFRAPTLILLITIISFPASQGAMIISGGLDEHNRNDTDFFGADYDWSGVSVNNNRRATMISPSYFLTANHYKPAIGSTATFKNATGTEFNYDIDSYAGMITTTYTYAGESYTRNSDLRLGKLSAPVDSSIEKYPIASDGSLYHNEDVYLYGANNYLGMNQLEELQILRTGDENSSWTDPDIIVGISTLMYYNASTSDDEAYLQSGDSSSPSFAVREGQLILAGIHWAISRQTDSPNENDFSIDTYVPAYINQITEKMSGESLTVYTTPEPASVMMLTLFAIMCCLHRRRS